MKSNKLLQNLKNDILKIASVCVDTRLSNRLVHIALDFESEFLKWINKKGILKQIPDLANPIVFETLKFLDTVVTSHPDGISKPDFVKYFVGTNNDKYLPTLISLSEILSQQGSAILEPFQQILQHATIFSSVGESDTESIKTSLSVIEKSFRQYLSTQINKPFGDDSSPSGKKSLTKRDKKKQLFYYLIDNISETIINLLDQYKFTELADQMRSDRMFLVNVNALSKSGLIGQDRDRSYMALQAQDVVKMILKRSEPHDYEYNYNLLVNSAMKFNRTMSDADFDKYFYNLMISKGREDQHPIKRVDFKPTNWVDTTFIEYISIALIMLMSQVQF